MRLYFKHLVSVCILMSFPDLMANIEWQTKELYPLIGSPEAKPGGIFNTYVNSFPLTLRQVGPDSNGSFRGYLDEQDISFVSLHPNTDEMIPLAATHWAFDKDQKTCYFKIRKDMTWSDGKAIRGEDYIFGYEFAQSKFIQEPFMNNYVAENYAHVELLERQDGQEVIKITLKQAVPEPWYVCNGITPIPKHFYHPLNKDFISNYNWKIQPRMGPYMISEVKKGRSIKFKRLRPWWGDQIPFFKHRFNVDQVVIKTIRERKVAWEHFLRGDLDGYPLVVPEDWYDLAKGEKFTKGYIHKYWFYVDTQISSPYIVFNQDYELFKDLNLRLGVIHAINWPAVNKLLWRNEYDAVRNISEGYGKLSAADIPERSFDLKESAKYLAKAGWTKKNNNGILTKDSRELSFILSYGADTLSPRLAIIKEEAKKAGIEIKLELGDSSSNFKSIREKKHQATIVGFEGGYFPEYSQFYHSRYAHIPQTNNISNTSDHKLDVHLDAYKFATNAEDRNRAAHLVQRMVHDRGTLSLQPYPKFIRSAEWGWVKFPKIPATKNTGIEPEGFPVFKLNYGGLLWIDEAEEKSIRAAMKAGKTYAPPVEKKIEIYRPKLP